MLTIYKASAGSGKTFTLAYEYIKLLLCQKFSDGGNVTYRLAPPGGHRHRHILAITFTNKATAEMKERIVKELASLAVISVTDPSNPKDDPDFAPLLIKEIGCDRISLRNAAKSALTDLLTDYRNFNVSTIDSFFQTVLRQFAREVDSQGDFDLTIDDREAMEAGLGLMFEDLKYHQKEQMVRLLSFMTHIAIEATEGKGGSNPLDPSTPEYKSIVEYMLKICNEDFKAHADDMQDYLSNPHALADFRITLRNAIEQYMDTACTAARKDASALLSRYAGSGFDEKCINSTLLNNFRNIAEIGRISDNARLDNDKRAGIFSTLQAFNPGDEPGRIYVKKYLPLDSLKKPVYPPDTLTVEMARIFDKAFRDDIYCRVWQKVLADAAMTDFISFVWEYTAKFRAENNMLLLSDTNLLLEKIISDEELPFIYDRLGVVLRHFLIDEFQDTSKMQWRNLRPLVGNGIAQGYDSLIIGDEKQAIYRFRNSDSGMLHSSVAEVDFPHFHPAIKGSSPGENTNYRSAHGIVRFNNDLFSAMAERLGVDTYGNVRQAMPDKTAPLTHYIRLTDIADSDQDPLEIMEEEIRRQLDSGYLASDITILTRYHSEGRKVAEYILRNFPDLKVMSEDALLLKNSTAIRSIIGMMRVMEADCTSATIDNDGENSAMIKSYRYGDIDFLISRYEFMVSGGEEPSQALLRACHDSDTVNAFLSDIRKVRDRHPADLPSLVEAIIDCRISKATIDKEIAYITAFQDLVTDFCQNNIPSVSRWLQWWDKKSEKLSIQPSSDIDAIKVLTIHQFKGLESPCIHIPFGSFELYKPNESLWLNIDNVPAGVSSPPPVMLVGTSRIFGCDGSPFKEIYDKSIHDQIEDNLNTLYVAFTRATRELIVTYNSSKHSGKYYQFNLEEIDTGMPTVKKLPESKPEKKDGTPADSNPSQIKDIKVEFNTYYRSDLKKLISLENPETATGDLSDSMELPEMQEAARRGNLLHSVMASLDRPENLNTVYDNIVRRENIPPQEAEALKHDLAQAFNAVPEYISRWWDANADIMVEQSIYDPTSPIPRRPDRLVFTGRDTVEIVDYKFTTDSHDSHFDQVRNYMSLLRQMGYVNVSGFLWYPFLHKVVQVK